LHPTSQTCTTINDVPNFQFEKEKGNMFGVGTSMEESSHALVVREFFLLRDYLSLHLHVQIFCLGGNAMKFNFRMWVF
jgi:hypothetical protein